MTAFIEYDGTPDRWREFYGDKQMPPPFSYEDSGAPYSLTGDGGIFTGGKDYLFFGAIAGVRNDTGIAPLVPPRGLPANLSPQVERALDSHRELGDFGTSWLRFSEIEAALNHHRVDRSLLSFETHTILAIMENLSRRLGDDRVRLVFGFG